MAPKKKLRRSAATLLGAKGLTRSQASKAMNTLGDEPLTTKQVEKAFEEAVGEVCHSDIACQIPLEQIDGEEFNWDEALPQGVLRDRAVSSACVSRSLGAIEASPSRPMHIMIAHDDVTAGNINKPDNKRKFCAFYFSIREFGRYLLLNSAFWFCVGILRSNIISDTVGGLSCIIAKIVRLFPLQTPENFASGALITVASTPRLFFGKISNIMADGVGEQPLFEISASARQKQCLRCNVVHLGLLTDEDERIESKDGYFVEIDCMDWAEIVKTTDQNMWDHRRPGRRLRGCMQNPHTGQESRNRLRILQQSSRFAR